MQQKRKINLLIVTHTLDTGGLEEVVYTYAKVIDKNRYNVCVAYVVGGFISTKLARIAGLRSVHLDFRRRWKRLFALWRIARSMEVDIVHNHLSWYGLLVGLLVRAKRVETVHNVYGWFSQRRRYGYAVYCLLAHRIIAVSDAVRQFTIQFFPLMREEKVIVIHNGIDTERFACTDTSRTSTRLGIPPSDVVIGFIGRLEEQKGVKFLLQAASRLNQQFNNLTFLILGDGSLAKTLKDECAALRVANVMFLGFQADPREFLLMMDVVVLPSLYEGLPISVLEAMAAGLPVVGSRVGGVPEAVEDGVSGFVVEPGNVTDLTEKLRLLIQNRDQRILMGKAGRERAVRHFSAAAMVAHTERVYEELLGAK